MKVFFGVSTIVITGLLLLITSCQQTNKGESKSHWQLRSPPGTAAGYGRRPLEINDAKDTSSVPPAGQNIQQETAHTRNESTLQQTETENDGPDSSAPSMKIEPPPSAAGYGSQYGDIEERKKSSSAIPAGDYKNGKANPAINGSTTEGPERTPPASGGYGPGSFTPTWTIKPPPSAAGYGK